MPDHDAYFIKSPTGATLALRHWPAPAPGRAVMVIAHDIAEHGGRHGDFAKVLNRHGVSVLAHDHRGHGMTSAADAPAGRFGWRGGADLVVGDILAVADHARAEHPGLPLILSGHGFGAAMAVSAAAQANRAHHAFDALALWGPVSDGGAGDRIAEALLLAERAFKGSDVPSILMAKLTFAAWERESGSPAGGFGWISRDAKAVSAYLADPLCGRHPSVSLWLDLFNLMKRARHSVKDLPPAMPVHVASGGSDPAGANGKAATNLCRRLSRSGMSQVTMKIVPGARHDLLRDPASEAIAADFAHWLETVIDRGKTVPAAGNGMAP